MIFILILALFVILAGIILLFLLSKKKNRFGILGEKTRIYHDTEKMPGKNMWAKSIPLVGKPDHLIRDGKHLIPVEIKNSFSPRDQYVNNTMQLMAYCLLVEENYNVRPPGGYIQYKDAEFKFAYTKEAEESVRLAVKEILECKRTNKEFQCKHQKHNNL